MASCHGIEKGDWYAISLITLREPRTDFQEVARLLAVVLAARFGARLHWGKWFPLGGPQVEGVYPGLDEFRAICEENDPGGVFRNAFCGEGAVQALGVRRIRAVTAARVATAPVR